MNIDIDEEISRADGFLNDDDARDYITSRVRELENLRSSLTLYRVVFLEDIHKLNRINLGHHWVDDQHVLDDQLIDYLKYECMGEEIEGNPYVIRAVFDKKDIDLYTTLRQNTINPHEGELFVKTSSKSLEPISYRPYEVHGDFTPLMAKRKGFDEPEILNSAITM